MNEGGATGPGWRRTGRWAIVAAYFAVLAAFGCAIGGWYDREAGFGYLIAFGGQPERGRVPEVESLNYFRQGKGPGYDAQFYVQIAMDPSLREPSLRTAIDDLPYRARRILMSWTAYVLGVGRPAWILQAYAIQNLLAWLALAAVLLRWFPPASWGNWFRWAGVLFGAGMCLSLRLALVDGPSLLLIALAVRAAERERRWAATALLALSGLARETNVLAGVALVRPREWSWRQARELASWAGAIALPLALWLGYIRFVAGPALHVGSQNFALPFAAFLERWGQIVGALVASAGGDAAARGGLAVIVALTVQGAFLLLRPRVDETWWRVGVAFTVLMAVLGPAVWEGFPGAAPRVLLPMQLAFNVLVPRGWKWWPVLLLGNLSLVVAPKLLEPHPGYGYRLSGPGELRINPQTRERARVVFDRNWYDAERRADRYWRWASDDASFAVINPMERATVAVVRMHLDGVDRRRASLQYRGEEVWAGTIGADDWEIVLNGIVLSPGENVFRVTTVKPSKEVGIGVRRPIAFSLRNLEIELLRVAK